MKKNKSTVSDKDPGPKQMGLSLHTELELEQGRYGLNRLDWLVPPLIAVFAVVWAFFYLGTSIEWDDLFYMNVSQYTTAQTWVLNRYGHIYLQKFFMWLVGDALAGAKAYWSFLFFSTAVFVYWCARILAGKKGFVIGLVAVLLYCMQPLFAYYAGCTFSDLTVMFLVMLGSFIYLAFFIGRQKHRNIVIMLLGLIFFWVTKSKETGVCFGLLFFGLGQDKTGVRSLRQFVRDIGRVGLGMLIGCLLLMSLDQVFIGDALFSIRPSSVQGLMGFNFRTLPQAKRVTSWYTYFSVKPLLAPLLLYLLIGYKGTDRRLGFQERLLWLLPLAIIFFIRVVRGAWHIVPRYFAPVIPGMCIWAAQFFRFNLSGALVLWKKHTKIPKLVPALFLILLSFIIVCVFMSYASELVEFFKLPDRDVFYTSVIMSLAITILLMVAGLSSKRGLIALFLSSISFFSIVYYPLSENLTSLKRMDVAKKSQWRYEPYRVFANELSFGRDVKILVSKDVHKRSWMLGREVRAHCWMFNVFFNQKFDYDQFIDGTQEEILMGGYTYAFVTWRQWKDLREKHNVEHLLKNYIIKADNETQIILLKKR